MPANRLNSEQRFIKNMLIAFFSMLFITLVINLIALFKTLITYSKSPELPSVRIKYCYDSDTCITTQGEKIRLPFVDTSELQDVKNDPITHKTTSDHLNN